MFAYGPYALALEEDVKSMVDYHMLDLCEKAANMAASLFHPSMVAPTLSIVILTAMACCRFIILLHVVPCTTSVLV